MSAALLALLLGGCTPEPPPAAGPCAAYAGDAGTLAACTTRVAASQADAAEARPLCDQLTPAASALCRTTWVEHRLNEASRPPREPLLAMCIGLPDCAFRVLDELPYPDVAEQLGACAGLAGPYAGDCAGHALQRWALRHPTDLERVTVAARPWPDRLGSALGLALWCDPALAALPVEDICARQSTSDTPTYRSCAVTLSAARRDHPSCDVR